MLAMGAAPEEEYLAEFMPPETWSPPDDANDGREFETMVSAKMKPDGSVCLTKLSGIGKDARKPEMDEMENDRDAMRGADMNNNEASGRGNY